MQMKNTAVLVAEDLHFDVLRLADEFFQKHRTVPERTRRFRLRFIEQLLQILRLAHHAHATTTAAGGAGSPAPTTTIDLAAEAAAWVNHDPSSTLPPLMRKWNIIDRANWSTCRRGTDQSADKAIAIAGGFTPRATKDRFNVTRRQDGIGTRGVLRLQDRVRPGDTVTVGERWFWDTLVDADPANNAMGWQWVAGCGADAAPYFRIFNPVLQGKKFDPRGDYVRRWVPELGRLPADTIHEPWTAAQQLTADIYPTRIVDHATARDRALRAFRSLKQAA